MPERDMSFTRKVNELNNTNYVATILFDMDDVVADFAHHLLHLYNEKYNDQLTPNDMIDWDMSKFVKKECGMDIFHLMKTPGFFRHLQPIEHAKDVIARLIEKNFNVLFVSDSPKGYSFTDYNVNPLFVSNPADDKRDWLAEHFPMVPTSNVILGSMKYYVRGDLLVDDKPDTYLKFRSLGLDVLLMDRPYNRFISSTNRIHNLLDAEEIIYKKFLK